MKKSISTRLLIITLSVCVFGMTLIAAISLTLSVSAIRTETFNSVSARTAGEVAHINNWVEKQISYATAVSTSLSYYNDYSEETLLPVLAAHTEKSVDSFEVYMATTDGKGIFSSGWIPDYEGGWLATKRDWYIGAVQQAGHPYVTSIYVDSDTGQLCITISDTIVNNGEIIGVAAIDMFLDALQEMVLGTGADSDNYMFLTDDEGNILIHPDSSLMSMDENFKNIADIDGGKYKELWDQIEPNEALKFMGPNETMSYYTMYPVDETGWRLFTVIPTSVVDAPVYALLRLIIPLFVGTLILAAVLIVVTVRNQIIRPITSISNASRALALGNTNIALDGKYNGELLMLQKSFIDMTESTRQQVASTAKLAEGDLTVEVPIRSEDDIMSLALDSLCHKLNDTMSNIGDSSTRVSQGSKQLSSHSQALAQSAGEQAAAIQELTTSISEISDKVSLNREKTALANNASTKIYENAKNGMALMEQMVAAVTEINAASSSISNVIKSIEDIAFQTNILALNAAVEAARAGQHGKGFAVVAEEVRSLASKSAEAAKQTETLIQNSISKTADGVSIAEKTNKALALVIGAIDESTELIRQMSADIDEEFTAITDVNSRVSNVNSMVQSNVTTSQGAAEEALKMSSEAELLSQAVAGFKLKNS